MGIISGNWVVSEMGQKQYLVDKKNGKDTVELAKGWCAIESENGSRGWYFFDNNGNVSKGLINAKDGNTYSDKIDRN